MKRRPPVNTDRIFAAADVLLDKLDSRDGEDSLVTVWFPGRTPVGREAPAFTQEEYVEAMAMLMRLGYVEPERPRR